MQPNEPYQQTTPPAPDYGFITNPEAPQPRKQVLPGSGSPVIRILIVLAGLIVLVVLFNVGKSILGSGSPAPLFLATAQDQQAMIHIVTAASQEPSISSPNKNFAITAELSLSSDRTKTLTYLKSNKTKIKDKDVSLKISLPLDTQLKDAATASTYNSLFPQVMKAKLLNYDQALKQANAKTKGAKGHALLKSQHDSAQLLLKQLEAANQ